MPIKKLEVLVYGKDEEIRSKINEIIDHLQPATPTQPSQELKATTTENRSGITVNDFGGLVTATPSQPSQTDEIDEDINKLSDAADVLKKRGHLNPLAHISMIISNLKSFKSKQ